MDFMIKKGKYEKKGNDIILKGWTSNLTKMLVNAILVCLSECQYLLAFVSHVSTPLKGKMLVNPSILSLPEDWLLLVLRVFQNASILQCFSECNVSTPPEGESQHFESFQILVFPSILANTIISSPSIGENTSECQHVVCQCFCHN